MTRRSVKSPVDKQRENESTTSIEVPARHGSNILHSLSVRVNAVQHRLTPLCHRLPAAHCGKLQLLWGQLTARYTPPWPLVKRREPMKGALKEMKAAFKIQPTATSPVRSVFEGAWERHKREGDIPFFIRDLLVRREERVVPK